MSSERLALELGASLGQVSSVRLLARDGPAVAELCERAQAFAREQGLREGLARAGELFDRAVQHLEAIESESRAALARASIELALEIARVLLGRELAQGNYDLEGIVRSTLSEAAVGRSPCVVHLHPGDHAALSATRFRSGTRLAPDEGVPRGDVHVETALGLLVRDLDGALESIGRRLRESLE